MSLSRHGVLLREYSLTPERNTRRETVTSENSDRQDAPVVLEGEVHLGQAERLARGAAVEDDVFHRVAAQLLGALLAHHPADGVGDVGLAAAVGPDDAGHALAEQQLGLVDERLEALDLESVQKHPCSPLARRPAGRRPGASEYDRVRDFGGKQAA